MRKSCQICCDVKRTGCGKWSRNLSLVLVVFALIIWIVAGNNGSHVKAQPVVERGSDKAEKMDSSAEGTGLLDFSKAPEGFIPPPLHPAGVQFETRRLSEGVYALLTNTAAVDNNGFIIGERGVLVIDSHISSEMANRILQAVRRVTDKPILYLVNTNYHGDQTFGNSTFPASTIIIAHRETAKQMKHFKHEKSFMLSTVNGDHKVFDDVKLRLPDVVFDKYMRIDLGGRVVELYHFGPGNTAGDVVVYQPDAKAAWTGNLVLGAGTIPPMFEYGAVTHLKTLTQFQARLDVKTIVPGHGFITNGTILTRYLEYDGELADTVGMAVRQGKNMKEVLAENP
ncbi:MAG: MBL fold metallo-hydrolase, partial [Planctomycetes bacterium]|nr:MBL fold metallo-hydrolase [Planctomycetota bacterium]